MKKTMFYVVASICLLLIYCVPKQSVFADTPIPKPVVEVTIIDENTGEDVSEYAQVEEIYSSVSPSGKLSRSLSNNIESNEVSYEVTFTVPGQIKPRADVGNSKNSDAKATINANYDSRKVNGKSQIRLNRVWGGWTPNNKMVIIESRQVGYQDTISYNSATKYPGGNSFTYTTGWGYVEHGAGGTGYMGYAESGARIRISGMGTGYMMYCRVSF